MNPTNSINSTNPMNSMDPMNSINSRKRRVSMKKIDRYRGWLLGLATGDAVGTALEFQPPGSFEPIDDMVGGGPANPEPGQWTDDTAMALCLADSLIERNGFDPVDQLERYVRWLRQGYLSSTGQCIDVGRIVASALL